jgi:hypothetical protein
MQQPLNKHSLDKHSLNKHRFQSYAVLFVFSCCQLVLDIFIMFLISLRVENIG